MKWDGLVDIKSKRGRYKERMRGEREGDKEDLQVTEKRKCKITCNDYYVKVVGRIGFVVVLKAA